MKIERLYEADPYIREFDARVMACEQVKDQYRILLDRTAFFPEGGGQPGDRGMIGEACIKDTHERMVRSGITRIVC